MADKPLVSRSPALDASAARLAARPSSIIGGALLALGLAALAAFALAAVDRWPPVTPSRAIAGAAPVVASVVISIVRPRWGIYLVLFVLPFFGNRPGGRFMELLDVLVAANLIGLVVHAMRERRPPPRGPIWWVAWAYALSAGVALVPAVPGILRRWLEVYDVPLVGIEAVTGRESDPLYSLASLGLLVLAVGWAMAVNWARTDDLALNASRACIVALLVTSLLGILDVHRIIDLEAAYQRVIDGRTVEGTGVFKSLFWNPSWFAWYFSMAFGVALGYSVLAPRRWRLVLLGAVAVCYAYFLTNPQRGGFIAVHATLALVAAYVLLHRPRRRLVKLLVAAGIFAASTVAVTALVHYTGGADSLRGLRRLVEHPTDEVRQKLMITALQMWRTSPLFGVGEGSFAWRYRDFVPVGSALDVHTYGDAHNTWLHLLATRGALGLLAYVALWVVIARVSISALVRKPRSPALPFVAAAAALFVYSFVQGMFYLQATQVFFWASIALLPPPTAVREVPTWPLRWPLLFGALLAFFLYAFWDQREPLRSAWRSIEYQPRGFYPIEITADGRVMRWSSRVGALCLHPTGTVTVVEFLAAHPRMARRPVAVNVSQAGRTLDRFRLTSTAMLARPLALAAWPPSGAGEGRAFGECRSDMVPIEVRVDRVWSPSSLRVADDPRHLGVAVFAPVDTGLPGAAAARRNHANR